MAPSPVWRYFVRGEGAARCTLCGKVIRTCGNTTNVKAHLQHLHADIHNKEWPSAPKTAKPKASKPRRTSLSVKEEPDYGTADPSSTSVEGPSSAPDAGSWASDTDRSWAPFSGSSSGPDAGPPSSTDANTSWVPDSGLSWAPLAGPSWGPDAGPSSTTVTTDSSQESNQSTLKGIDNEDQNLWSSNGAETKRVIADLVLFLCLCNLPHSIVETTGMKNFLGGLAPQFKIPSGNTVSAMVSEKGALLKEKIREKLKTQEFISLAVDIAIVSNREFLVVSAHFHDNLQKMQAFNLAITHLDINYTTENISCALKEAMNSFHIPISKIVGVCTDSSSNMKEAIRDAFGPDKHIHCFAHVLNLIVQSALIDNANSYLASIIRNVRALVTFSHHSATFNYMLKAAQIAANVATDQVKILVNEVGTGWNSKLCMIRTFLELCPYLAQIIHEPINCSAPKMIYGHDQDILAEVVLALAPFEEAINIISDDSSVTGSMVIPLISYLERELARLSTDLKTPHAITLVKTLISNLLLRKDTDISKGHLSTATLLDPRFKSKCFDKYSIDQHLTDLREQVNCCQSSSDRAQTRVVESSTPLSFFERMAMLVENDASERAHDQMDEVAIYLGSKMIGPKEDPLKFWDKCRVVYPGLTLLAAEKLCVVGNCVPSEKLVSELERVLSEDMGCLTDEHVEERILLSTAHLEYLL